MAKLGLYCALATGAALLVPVTANAADEAAGFIHFRGSVFVPAECSVRVVGGLDNPQGKVQCPQRGAAGKDVAPKTYSHVGMAPVMLQPDAKGVRVRAYIATIEYL